MNKSLVGAACLIWAALSAAPAESACADLLHPAANEIVVYSTSNVASIVTAAAAGTTFCFSSGTYRMQAIQPKNNDQFIGPPVYPPTAILNGSKILTQFTQVSANVWEATNQTQYTDTYWSSAQCAPAYPACFNAENIFIDNAVQIQVASQTQVSSGQMYFDYTNHIIYFYLAAGDSPQNHLIEATVTPFAFNPSYSLPNPSGVVISYLEITKYATPGHFGTIDMVPPGGSIATIGSNWTITNNLVDWNHGSGATVGPQAHVSNNQFNNNGQLGLGAGDDENPSYSSGTTCDNPIGRASGGIVIQNNEIANNNWAQYYTQNEAGGIKVVTSGMLFDSNWVHDNNGDGFWADVHTANATITNNWFENNAVNAVHYEISYLANISNNVMIHNGWVGGWTGVYSSASGSVTINNNKFYSNDRSIAISASSRADSCGPYATQNETITNNLVCYTSYLDQAIDGYANTPPTDPNLEDAYKASIGIANGTDNIVVDYNNYYSNPSVEFSWAVSTSTGKFSYWQANNGNDAHGSYTVTTSDPHCTPPTRTAGPARSIPSMTPHRPQGLRFF